MTSAGSLWNYYRDEIGNVDDNALDSKEFKYQTRIVGKTPERRERPERQLQKSRWNSFTMTTTTTSTSFKC